VDSRPHPEFPHSDYELRFWEEGNRVALYAEWPSVFPVAFGSLRHSMAMNRLLTDLHNAVAEAHHERRRVG
jgi:hypothetical protein